MFDRHRTVEYTKTLGGIGDAEHAHTRIYSGKPSINPRDLFYEKSVVDGNVRRMWLVDAAHEAA